MGMWWNLTCLRGFAQITRQPWFYSLTGSMGLRFKTSSSIFLRLAFCQISGRLLL
uniref:Alternative protein RYR2 n=1 Tax=Homo sapiens TaxID=9606 RepID=L8E9M2_HUMAN|nr:alternative protein RYR2 [Homo sapiens]